MSKYIQKYQLQAYVPVAAIHRVMAACIEHDVREFTVADDRGGSGHWNVVFEELPRKKVREIVGPGIHIEPI